MKVHTNQNGFSLIETLLIVIVIGIIGTIGWYITQSRSNSSKSSGTPKTTQAQEDSSRKLPEGTSVRDGDYIIYTNTSLGLTFRYPIELTSLGERPSEPGNTAALSLHEDTATPRDAGLAYSFQGMRTKTGGNLITKDWKSSSYITGFTSYNSCLPPEYNTGELHIAFTETLYEVNNDVCVKSLGIKSNTSSEQGGVGDFAIIVLEKKLNNDDYSGIQMTFYQIGLKDFSQSGLINAYSRETKKLIADIAESMKDIQ
jgi:type II secretory pathway pseudopilin PulG